MDSIEEFLVGKKLIWNIKTGQFQTVDDLINRVTNDANIIEHDPNERLHNHEADSKSNK